MSFPYTYELDEFQLIEGAAAYLYGEAELLCENAGCYGESFFVYDVVEIKIQPHDSKGKAVVLKKGDELFGYIASRIKEEEDEYIQRKLQKREDDEEDAYMADAYDRMKDARATGDL